MNSNGMQFNSESNDAMTQVMIMNYIIKEKGRVWGGISLCLFYLYTEGEYSIPISLKTMTHQTHTHTLYTFEDPHGHNKFPEPLTQA